MSEKAVHEGWYSKHFHYSHHQSKKFWRRINAIKDKKLHHDLYLKGCQLQNLEHQMINALLSAEGAEKFGD
jgi:hypothetical protein